MIPFRRLGLKMSVATGHLTTPYDKMKKKQPPQQTIDKILPGVSAIDIGQSSNHVAVAEQEVRQFGTHLCDVRDTLAYLKEHRITRVAMEATGVYWICLHDMLEEAGIEVTVFNGAHARNLPGRGDRHSGLPVACHASQLRSVAGGLHPAGLHSAAPGVSPFA